MSRFVSVGVLARALGSGWAEFSEELGLWIPFEVTHKEHDDKPVGVEEFGNHFIFLKGEKEIPIISVPMVKWVLNLTI